MNKPGSQGAIAVRRVLRRMVIRSKAKAKIKSKVKNNIKYLLRNLLAQIPDCVGKPFGESEKLNAPATEKSKLHTPSLIDFLDFVSHSAQRHYLIFNG